MSKIGEGPISAKDLTPDKVKMRPKAKNPVKICDTTFRDAHQSTVATRMRTEDMEWMASDMDNCGFYSMEVWGGATFDVPHRFLGEDPWDRPRKLKGLMPNTPLLMLLRGQNLVAYRNHPDDLVDAFVTNGITNAPLKRLRNAASIIKEPYVSRSLSQGWVGRSIIWNIILRKLLFFGTLAPILFVLRTKLGLFHLMMRMN
jgi:hypothetical protein